MKKYYFKGTNHEVKLGDKIEIIITCSDGTKMRTIDPVDNGTIEDLLMRDSIEVKEEAPVRRKNKHNHNSKNKVNKANKYNNTSKDLDNIEVKTIKLSSINDLFGFLNEICKQED